MSTVKKAATDVQFFLMEKPWGRWHIGLRRPRKTPEESISLRIIMSIQDISYVSNYKTF
jgi:hypothetical protein